MEFSILSNLIIFTIGICMGSFLNVVIDRFATGRTIVKGRSYCESCKKTLEARDLVPLISFLILKGKCRYCKKGIPFRIFAVELIVGIISVFIFSFYFSIGVLPLLVIYFLTLLFIAIFFIDLEYGIIPDKLTILLTVLSFVFVFVSQLPFLNHLLAGFGSLLFFVGLFAITKGRGMGLGDVKISFSLGLILGFPLVVYSLYLAFLTGAIVSIILVLWKKRSFRGGTVPFGPFLTASTLFTLFFGEKIILPLASLLF